MNQRTAGEGAGASTGALERLHEQTWEIELLLSGALLLVIFRLPGAADPAPPTAVGAW